MPKRHLKLYKILRYKFDKNIKIHMMKITESTYYFRNGKIFHVHGLEDLVILSCCFSTQFSRFNRFNVTSIKIVAFFNRNWQAISKILIEIQITLRCTHLGYLLLLDVVHEFIPTAYFPGLYSCTDSWEWIVSSETCTQIVLFSEKFENCLIFLINMRTNFLHFIDTILRQ